MPPDAAATKARLLDAAFAEFAQYGVAGARIDRIAEAAGANKRLIYVYFGNKDELFDIVIGQALELLANAVPFDPDDLPSYSGKLFDYLLAHPQVLRLNAWKQLERPGVTEIETAAYRPKLDKMASARRRGTLELVWEPTDLLAFVFGLAGAWIAASPSLQAFAPDPAWSTQRLTEHRAALVAAVAAVTAAAAPPTA